MLKMLLAVRRKSSARNSLMAIVLFTDIFSDTWPGPSRMLRHAECRDVEPLERGTVANAKRLVRNNVGAHRTADAAADVHSATQNAHRVGRSRSEREVAAPLPAAENVRPRAFFREAPVFAKRQINDPIAVETVALIEA